MRYCLNPHCPNPRNPNDTEVCYSCGASLLLDKRYRAIKLIGQGGFGRTFLAEDDSKPTQPRCVIKQFYPEGQTNARTAADLFQKEALRLKKLGEHPQIPDFYEHLEQDNHQYIIQEFIDGQNLAQELAENGVFKENDLRNLLKDLLPVLKFIHKDEIIHRDIKPDNIIRSHQQGHLFLVDFGAAKYATTTALGKTGTVIGSAEFIAPEQLRGKATFASDIYSLGVTCIYLLTQVSPFNLFDVTEDTWVWQDYLVDNPVRDELRLILNKMIHNSLKERYHTVDEILKDLKISSYPVKLINFPTNQQPQKWQCIQTLLGHSGAVNSLAFSPDGNLLASGDEDGTIKLWSGENGQEIDTLIGHLDKITCIAFNPNGQLLASSSWDKTVKIYNLINRRIIKNIAAHKNWVSSVAFSLDNKILASGSFDKSLKLWDKNTGIELKTFVSTVEQNWVTSLCFHPYLPLLAAGYGDNLINIFDVNYRQKTHRFLGHIGMINSLAFSPDGQILASGSRDKTIKLWQFKTGHQINSLKEHLEPVNSIAFSPNGQFLASGSTDTTVKIWRFEQPSSPLIQEDKIITLNGHSQSVRAVAFSPDGKLLASSGDDGKIKIWQCD